MDMNFFSEVAFQTNDLLNRIGRMPDEELDALYRYADSDTGLRVCYSGPRQLVLNAIIQVRNARHEHRRREELHDALISFLRSNSNLGSSIESGAARIADALARAGIAVSTSNDAIAEALRDAGISVSASTDAIAEALRDAHLDVSSSDLPSLVTVLRDALAHRNHARRRLT